jgi:CheY-like chemotaxis protein
MSLSSNIKPAKNTDSSFFGKSILLVEDNEMNLEMLARRLTRAGFRTIEARSGEESLDLMNTTQVDIILMDISMPGIGGIEATKRIKNNKKTASVPIIALTAKAMPGDKEAALKAGCDDYDSKPVRLNRLILKIEQLISGS